MITDFNGLRAFVATAKLGSLTKAAEELCITQPAVTSQLKKLQTQLDMILLQRNSRGMDLTEAGRQLLPAAESAVSSIAEFEAAAKGMKASIQGQLRIGTIIDPEFLRLGDTLKFLRSRHPGLLFDLQQGISGSVTQAVINQELDAGFTLGTPGFGDLSPHLSVLPLATFQYRVVAPAGWTHEVRGKRWAELAQLPWIATPDSSIHSKLLNRAFAQAGVTPNVAARVDVEPSMIDLVKSGVALSLIRDNLAIKAAHEDGLVIADQVALEAHLGFIWRTDRSDDPVVKAAIGVVEQIW